MSHSCVQVCILSLPSPFHTIVHYLIKEKAISKNVCVRSVSINSVIFSHRLQFIVICFYIWIPRVLCTFFVLLILLGWPFSITLVISQSSTIVIIFTKILDMQIFNMSQEKLNAYSSTAWRSINWIIWIWKSNEAECLMRQIKMSIPGSNANIKRFKLKFIRRLRMWDLTYLDM